MNKYANRLEKTKNKIEEIDKIIAENVAKKQRLEEQYEELCRLTLADALGCDPNNINTIIMSDPATITKLRCRKKYLPMSAMSVLMRTMMKSYFTILSQTKMIKDRDFVL